MTAQPLPALACACASLRRAARAVTQSYEPSSGARDCGPRSSRCCRHSNGRERPPRGRWESCWPSTPRRSAARSARSSARAGSAPTEDRTAAKCAGRSRPRVGGAWSARSPPGSGHPSAVAHPARPELWALLVEDLAPSRGGPEHRPGWRSGSRSTARAREEAEVDAELPDYGVRWSGGACGSADRCPAQCSHGIHALWMPTNNRSSAVARSRTGSAGDLAGA